MNEIVLQLPNTFEGVATPGTLVTAIFTEHNPLCPSRAAAQALSLFSAIVTIHYFSVISTHIVDRALPSEGSSHEAIGERRVASHWKPRRLVWTGKTLPGATATLKLVIGQRSTTNATVNDSRSHSQVGRSHYLRRRTGGLHSNCRFKEKASYTRALNRLSSGLGVCFTARQRYSPWKLKGVYIPQVTNGVLY
jgi:hypothetical protein